MTGWSLEPEEELNINNFICFDLEGPLSPQDNAYELMKLIPQGSSLFELISRYDDLLTMEGREDYEPGDTLALIVPFLVLHKIQEKDIIGLARKASYTKGAAELIADLKAQGWEIFCITTTYEQYANHIAAGLGIPIEHIAATSFSLDKFNQELSTNRALAVKNYLVTKGIAESRIKAVGFGCTKPIYTDTDESHQAKNRRVEFKIVQK